MAGVQEDEMTIVFAGWSTLLAGGILGATIALSLVLMVWAIGVLRRMPK